MTPQRLAELRALAAEGRAIADKATPGPWLEDGEMVVTVDEYYLGIEEDIIAEDVARDEDSEHIADARTRVPKLAGAVEELAREVERLSVKKVTSHIPSQRMSRAERREARRQIAPDPRPVVDAEDYEELKAERDELQAENVDLAVSRKNWMGAVEKLAMVAFERSEAIAAERLAHLGTVLEAIGWMATDQAVAALERVIGAPLVGAVERTRAERLANFGANLALMGACAEVERLRENERLTGETWNGLSRAVGLLESDRREWWEAERTRAASSAPRHPHGTKKETP